jgi:hypothetical protein
LPSSEVHVDAVDVRIDDAPLVNIDDAPLVNIS